MLNSQECVNKGGKRGDNPFRHRVDGLKQQVCESFIIACVHCPDLVLVWSCSTFLPDYLVVSC